MTDNLYETQARTRKAVRLMSVARERGWKASEVANYSDLRAALLAVAEIESASPTTWAMVVTMLDEAEKRAQELASATVHHIDGDPRNNDLDNLELR